MVVEGKDDDFIKFVDDEKSIETHSMTQKQSSKQKGRISFIVKPQMER